MSFRFLLSSLVCVLMLGSCGNTHTNPVSDPVKIGVYDPNGGSDLFHSDRIREIELIPLETSDSSLIGVSPECMTDRDGNYYIADMNGSQRILRYDASGRYLNAIGNRGRGPREYLELSNCLIDTLTGNVFVFSGLDKKMCVYGKDGSFVSGRTFNTLFSQGRPDGEYFWLYQGYMNGNSDYRVLKVDAQEKVVEALLPADIQIMPMDELFPVFIPSSDGNLMLREAFSDRIYRLSADSLTPVYGFDFGDYNIPREFYEIGDVYKSAEYIMKRNFVCIDRFMESHKYMFVQALIKQSDNKDGLIYGILDKVADEWQWYTFENTLKNNSLGVGSVRTLTSRDELICLVDPVRLMEMTPEKRAVFRNPEVINDLNEESNPVVLKCHLK